MMIRSALVAAVALAGFAAPATAGDMPPLPPLPDETYDEPYQEDYVPQMGSTHDRRAAWLADCRAAYSGYHDDGDEGAVIGGVLGAVAGGVAGNAIDDGGTAGTLVGAGVGAVAGAAVGSAIDESSDRGIADYCEDYLARYEQGYGGYGYDGHGYGGGYVQGYPGPGYGGYAHAAPGYGAYPGVMWVRVPIHRNCDCQPRTRVERIVERVPAPTPRAAPPRPDKRVKIERVVPAPAPARGKLIPIK